MQGGFSTGDIAWFLGASQTTANLAAILALGQNCLRRHMTLFAFTMCRRSAQRLGVLY